MAMAVEMFQPPKLLPTKEWIESEFQLPDFGVYDFYYTPYFMGVAAALDDASIDEVDLMKAAQIGWTYFLIGYILKRIAEADTNPCPIMLLFAKTGDAKNFHDEKLVPAGSATTVMHSKIDFKATRTSGVRWDNRAYDGGFLKLVGSNSPGNVKSTSKVGLGVVEEPDDTTDNVAGQGDAIGLLEERLKRYVGSKMIVGGTPAVKGLSKIEARLEQSDKRQLPIRCHECRESHVLNFDNVIWDSDPKADHLVYGTALPETAVYVCPCGTAWDDYQRQENIRDTCFDAWDSGDKMAGWVANGESHGRAGFTGLSELYVCMPGTSLADVVQDKLAADYEAAKGNQNALIKFVNQKLGLPYEFKGDQATADELRERAEEYPELLIPLGACRITIGIDVQPDRLAVIIRAWGKDLESWLIYWGEIHAIVGVTDIRDPVWDELDKVIFGNYRHASGCVMRVLAACIDSGDGNTNDAVYHYVRTRKNRGVNLMAIKGSNNFDAPIYRLPKRMDLNAQKNKADRFGLQVWQVGTQLAKDLIAGRLKMIGTGAGRMHWFQDVRPDYFDQMTGEVKAPSKTQRGKMTWQQKAGARIEAWDCEVYALHAAYVEKLHQKSNAWWDRIGGELLQGDLLGGGELHDVIEHIDDRPEPETDPEPDPAGPAVANPVRVMPVEPIQPANTVSMADLGRMMSND